MTTPSWPVKWAVEACSLRRGRWLMCPTTIGKVIYEGKPGPFNICTEPTTFAISTDERHPFNLSIVERLMNFDHNRLHVRVKCSGTTVNTTIRRHVERRVRSAFDDELKQIGFDRYGKPLSSSPSEPRDNPDPKSRIIGALQIVLTKAAVTASPLEIRQQCQRMVRHIAKLSLGPDSRKVERGDSQVDLVTYRMAKKYLAYLTSKEKAEGRDFNDTDFSQLDAERDIKTFTYTAQNVSHHVKTQPSARLPSRGPASSPTTQPWSKVSFVRRNNSHRSSSERQRPSRRSEDTSDSGHRQPRRIEDTADSGPRLGPAVRRLDLH